MSLTLCFMIRQSNSSPVISRLSPSGRPPTKDSTTTAQPPRLAQCGNVEREFHPYVDGVRACALVLVCVLCLCVCVCACLLTPEIFCYSVTHGHGTTPYTSIQLPTVNRKRLAFEYTRNLLLSSFLAVFYCTCAVFFF